MQPNKDLVTGIAYGVMNANNINGDFLSSLLGQGVIDVDFLLLRIKHAQSEAGYVLSEKLDSESTFQYQKRIEDELDSLDYNWFDFFDEHEDFIGSVIVGELDGVEINYDPNDNICIITKSPVVVKCSQCSPCFPGAGNIDEPNEDGIETYSIPQEWFIN